MIWEFSTASIYVSFHKQSISEVAFLTIFVIPKAHLVSNMTWHYVIVYYLLNKGAYVSGSDGLFVFQSVWLLATLLKTLPMNCGEILWKGPGW